MFKSSLYIRKAFSKIERLAERLFLHFKENAL